MGKFKPIFDSLSTAGARGARHADANLPIVSVNLKNVFGDVRAGTKRLEDTKFHADAPNKPKTHKPRDGGDGTKKNPDGTEKRRASTAVTVETTIGTSCRATIGRGLTRRSSASTASLIARALT